MKLKKFTALLLALAMLFALAACRSAQEAPSGEPSEEVSQSLPPSEAPSAPPSEQPSDEPDPSPLPERTTVRFAVLSGPTGVGAAKLLHDNDEGDTVNYYEYDIANDNSELVAGLTNGTLDIATVASNVAVNLYNRTDGDIRIIALGTQGVLHILESGGSTDIQDIQDLAGRTVYCAGQGANPEYILRYLLREYELDDVELVFADATEISAKLLSGEIQCAMLPVPAATATILRSEGSVRAAVDLTQAWDDLQNGSQLIMTAVVARARFIEEQPQAVADFLTEYAASIDYTNNNVDEAAAIVASFGITPSAPIARQAIPQCHLVFISGRDMSTAISDYFMQLYSIDPAAVGGSLPDDGIYYVP